jgi:phosphoglycerate dehydrogenase-like enzyme
VVLDPSHPRGVAEAFRTGEPYFELVEPAAADDLAAVVASAPILVTGRWDPGLAGSGVRWIQSISAGVEQFPAEDLHREGIVLTSARGVHGVQVAEHALALLLAMTRGVGVSMRNAEHTTWRRGGVDEIAGKTMAILGLGAIGEEIARRATALGVDVIGVKAIPEGYEGVATEVFGPDAIVEVCRRADIVVSVLPESSATRHVLSDAALEALGAGWLVNVGRGSAVDTSALLRALDRGELRGAGLDVFEEEPLTSDSPLWGHPRVVLTPHIAGLSPRYGERLLAVFLDNLSGYLGEGPWSTRVV